MQARLAAVVVAIALAIGGAIHHGRWHESRSAVAKVPPTAIELISDDPGGWWDWH